MPPLSGNGLPDDAGVDRRDALRLMGASLALAGLTGCTVQPARKIVPYVDQPEEVVPGKPLFFATTMPWCGYGMGVLVESHEGRPTKVEGNPGHPASLGATDAFAQASVLSLYDPDRSQAITYRGEISSWSAFLEAIRRRVADLGTRKGLGLRILTGAVTSPTLAWQMGQLLGAYPQAKWHSYEPARSRSAAEGARLAFGQPVHTVYRFDRAELVVSLDSDFLNGGPTAVRYAHDFMSGRRVREGQTRINRLYVAESTPSLTGAVADHRIPVTPSVIPQLAAAVAAGVKTPGVTAGAPAMNPQQRQWVDAVVHDLERHRGRSIVIAGEEQPAALHALAHAMNSALGNAGHIQQIQHPEASAEAGSLEELARDMQSGAVQLLVLVGVNPVYNAPADLDFARRMGKVGLRVHLGSHTDETADYSHWHIPEAHYLESWGDARAYDGTVSLVQPLIAPLHGSVTAYELISALVDKTPRQSRDIVHDYWKGQYKSGDFEEFWRKTLHDGVMAGTSFSPRTATVRSDFRYAAAVQPQSGLELQFRPDPTVFDGRFANNGWLQELPKPLTKLTWDNAALVSPATAAHLGVQNEDVVRLRVQGRRVDAPVWVVPGQADNCVTVTLGYGRTRAGTVGSGTGFNAYAIRTSAESWTATGLSIGKTGRRYPLSETQHHHTMQGRDLIRAASIGEFLKNPRFAQNLEWPENAPLSLLPGFPYEGNKWGMAIDLTACIGCSACVVACQAENNIPVVGKRQVAIGREMQWIRIDRYFEGGVEAPAIHFQPVPCMHCENAPCELVCPVAATVHSPDGLNEMIYNRCVGTRYCSNNCPYKVRRFNFYNFTADKPREFKLLMNPDVTVRSRGVMEKCTYCIQRISAVKIEAEKQNRAIRDGEIVPACAQACPTQAIVFGDINDPHSRVAKLKAGPLNYGLLTELTTRPRTTYLARVGNPGGEI